MLLNGSKAVGTEIVRSANEMVGEIGKKPLKDLLKHHSKKNMENLLSKAENKLNSKLEGQGIKRKRSLEDNFSQIVKRIKLSSAPKSKSKLKKPTKPKKAGVKTKLKKKKKQTAKELFIKKYSLKSY